MKFCNVYKTALILLFVALSFSSKAQFVRTESEDSIAVKRVDTSGVTLKDDGESVVVKKGLSRPAKAAILSAVIPGAGQIYNKRYWKAPIIWGVSGFLIYNIVSFNRNYKNYREEAYNREYIQREDPDNDSLNIQLNPAYRNLTLDQVRFQRDDYQRYRDLNSIILFAVYFINVLDAVVDAHLMDFRVSEDAIMSFAPWSDCDPLRMRKRPAVGIGLTLTWVK